VNEVGSKVEFSNIFLFRFEFSDGVNASFAAIFMIFSPLCFFCYPKFFAMPNVSTLCFFATVLKKLVENANFSAALSEIIG